MGLIRLASTGLAVAMAIAESVSVASAQSSGICTEYRQYIVWDDAKEPFS